MNIQELIAAKREALHEATQARVDATHREIRAAIDVIVTSVRSALPDVAFIEFDVDEITGEVGLAQLLDAADHLVAPSELSERFWHTTAGLIAPDEFMVAIPGLEPLERPGTSWRLTITTYLAHVHRWATPAIAS